MIKGSLQGPFIIWGVCEFDEGSKFDKTRERFDPSGASREPAGSKQPLGCFE